MGGSLSDQSLSYSVGEGSEALQKYEDSEEIGFTDSEDDQEDPVLFFAQEARLEADDGGGGTGKASGKESAEASETSTIAEGEDNVAKKTSSPPPESRSRYRYRRLSSKKQRVELDDYKKPESRGTVGMYIHGYSNSKYDPPPKPKEEMTPEPMEKAPILSVASVMAALKDLAGRWREVGRSLHIPSFLLDIIESEYPVAVECLKAAMRYWLAHDPHASWRRLIVMLDGMREVATADNIRDHAENITDPLLSSRRILFALKTVQDLERVLCLPPAVCEGLKQQNSEEEEYKKQLVRYWLRSSCYASWNWLSGRLAFLGETVALEKVKRKVKHDLDAKLSLAEYAELLGGVGDWNLFMEKLDFPSSAGDAIKEQYNNPSQQHVASLKWYQATHPAPSWRQVADALFLMGEHDILDVLYKDVHFLRGSKHCHHLYSAALKKGSVIKAEVGKFVIHGPVGSGRRSALDVMMETSSSREDSDSTAPQPVSICHVDITRKKWVKLSFEDRKRALVKAIVGKSILASKTAKMIPEDSDEVQYADLPSHTADGEPSPGALAASDDPSSSAPVSRGSSISSDLNSRSTLYEDLVQLIDEYARSGVYVTKYRKIICIDSGGQPQFHELIPAFLRDLTTFMFTFKASEDFSTRVKVEGMSEDCPDVPLIGYQSNFQVVRSCMRPLMTYRIERKRRDKIGYLMFVGTHRDLEERCVTESMERKNRKIGKLFVSPMRNEMVYHTLRNWDIIIPFNGKEPDDSDKKSMKDLREISCENLPDAVEIPLQYFALELVLEEASQILGRNVLSVEECLEAASYLDFDSHSIVAALKFLDKISAVHYFPQYLDGVVFTSIQVLLDKMLELVKKANSLRMDIDKKESRYIPELWQNLRDRGLLSMELLSSEEFQKHYVPDLFTPTHLVKLFKGLTIIQDFHDGQLFMPALLPLLEGRDFSAHCVDENAPVHPLAIYFPVACPQAGIFCSLISYLVSSKNQHPSAWSIELEPDSNIPACLYRNCVRFSLPSFSGSVTVMDALSHFEVHVRPEDRFLYTHASWVIRALLDGIRHAKLMFGYCRCSPEVGVVCPCDIKEPHVATMNDSCWICRLSSTTYGSGSESQLLWHHAKPQPPGRLDYDPSLGQMLRFPMRDRFADLTKEIKGDPWGFGYALLGADNRQQVVQLHSAGDESRFVRRIIEFWLRADGSVGRAPVSWDTFAEVLKEIGLHELASGIEERIPYEVLSPF